MFRSPAVEDAKKKDSNVRVGMSRLMGCVFIYLHNSWLHYLFQIKIQLVRSLLFVSLQFEQGS